MFFHLNKCFSILKYVFLSWNGFFHLRTCFFYLKTWFFTGEHPQATFQKPQIKIIHLSMEKQRYFFFIPFQGYCCESCIRLFFMEFFIKLRLKNLWTLSLLGFWGNVFTVYKKKIRGGVQLTPFPPAGIGLSNTICFRLKNKAQHNYNS